MKRLGFAGVLFAVAMSSAAAQQPAHCGQKSGGNVTTCMACIGKTQPDKVTPKMAHFWCTSRIAELRAEGHFK